MAQIKDIKSCTVLYNGVKMPWLGFGVFKVEEGATVINAVKKALEAGYLSIDTAAAYFNEEGVGKAIKESGIPRENLFITTKVWNSDHGFDSTLRAFDKSLEKLGLDYLDLYLIHWPVAGKYKETWRALENLYREGKTRAIGVCNFTIEHLQDLLADCSLKPMVNQVEFHPLLYQKDLLTFCRENDIQLEAWSPLMQGNLDVPEIIEIGKKYNKSPAQIILRWDLQQGVVTIPKSITLRRILENADIFDFELAAEDMEILNNLNQDKAFGPTPENFHLILPK